MPLLPVASMRQDCKLRRQRRFRMTNSDLTRNQAEREQAEGALRERDLAAQRLQAVIAAAPMVVWAIDRQGIKTLSVGKLLEKWGRKQNEMGGQSIFEVA